jgi:hypothetical protein
LTVAVLIEGIKEITRRVALGEERIRRKEGRNRSA